MKHIKTYENDKFDLEIGDYVVCAEQTTDSKLLKMFISQNIGKYIRNISGLEHSENNKFPYLIQYENYPEELLEYFTHSGITMGKNEILNWSKTKKELEPYVVANKYNL